MVATNTVAGVCLLLGSLALLVVGYGDAAIASGLYDLGNVPMKIIAFYYMC